MDKIMDKVHELGKSITEDPRHIAWIATKDAHDTNEELQAKIVKFNTTRSNLMSANTEETRDEAKIDELSKEMRGLYDEIMGDKTMQDYLEKQQEINTMVSEITGIIQFYVTGEEPSSCGGSCSSCSGCS